MKKLFAMLLLFAAALGGAETQPQGFSARIIPTKAVNIADQFVGILPGRPPFFSKVSKAVCGEPFTVHVVFSGAEIKNGKVSLSGKINLTAPDGKKTELPLREFTAKLSGDTRGVFLLPDALHVSFDPPDPKGNYTFALELTDRNTGRTATDSASVENVENIPGAPESEAMKKLADNYRAPCPENIVPAFRAYLKMIPAQKQKEKPNFNPLPQLALFYFALKDNPQCVPAFAECFKKLNKEEKLLAAVVLNFVSEESAKALNADQRKAIAQQFPANPFVIEKAQAPWHLDICWSEFLIRGTKAPVMKVANALSLAGDAITIPDFKKIQQPTAEDWRKLGNHLTAMAAHWSIKSLAKSHPLVRYYIEAALVRKEIADPVTGAVAANAIGMKVEVTPPKK